MDCNVSGTINEKNLGNKAKSQNVLVNVILPIVFYTLKMC
jgi:hypothetical protein